jgi:hypothetical protein
MKNIMGFYAPAGSEGSALEGLPQMDFSMPSESARDPFAEFEDLFKDSEQSATETHESNEMHAPQEPQFHEEPPHEEPSHDPFADFEELFGKPQTEEPEHEAEEEKEEETASADENPPDDLEHFLNIDEHDIMKDLMDHHEAEEEDLEHEKKKEDDED